jgi:glucose/arabinose dehydrogenase/PKD repeat protein
MRIESSAAGGFLPGESDFCHHRAPEEAAGDGRKALHRGLGLARIFCGILGLLLAGRARMEASTLPPYFTEESIGGTWEEACGLTFDAFGRMYVWERTGRVWIVEANGNRLPTPLIDLHEEVGGWRDLGLLGFALDPHFEQNGYIYLLYTVDRHHLKYFGTASYRADTDEYFAATIGRLTRYTARAADGFRSVDPASRRILIGETIRTGFPSLYQSHGPGTLVFGADGTLLISAGEGASYDGADNGGAVAGSYAPQGMSDGIIQQKENVGAYRAQLVDSLSGKILRVDPATGDGVPGNPFYDATQPRAARSRVWALGVRNPYRMTLRPNTGSPNRADANPGTLYVGDVGWGGWEELNIVQRPGQNFGWPIFEGMESQSEYDQHRAANRDALNPLYNTGGCSERYFSFHDLMHDDTLDPNPWFPNPCDISKAVPASLPLFVHSRAALEWRDLARTSGYDPQGNGTILPLGGSGSPVAGTNFSGECSVGGAWYSTGEFPASYSNTYFHADFESGWIRNLTFDAQNKLVAVREFLSNGGGIVAIVTHPSQPGLFYVRWGMEVVKVSYSLSLNQRPLAVAAASRSYGPAPLVVQFTGSNSSDPEGSPLSYRWNFGDGSSESVEPNPSHTFQAPGATPITYTVTLTVSDTNNATGTATLHVAVNNSPPTVAITCPVEGTLYSMLGDTIYQLRADVRDAEHSDGQLLYQWQTFLHHNDHQHSEPIETNHSPTVLISPIGCSGDETYHFRIVLVVTDPGGLSATNEVQIYPDCSGRAPDETFPTPWMQRDIGAVSAAGNSSYSNRVFTVAGSGDDIWGNVDEFRFTYWAHPGDGLISAHVASQGNTQPGAKAGVMIRETVDPGSRYAMACVTPTGLLFQYRTTPGGSSGFNLIYDLSAPYWVKLVRSGNRFTGYSSPDGASWSPMGTATVAMATATLGGMAVSSHNDGLLSTVLFDHVVGIVGPVTVANGALPSPWQSGDVGWVTLPGGATYASSVFNVGGSGEGIGNANDAFFFVRRPWTSDVEIIARLASLQNSAPWAKAGLMIRESLADDSANVTVFLSPQNGAGLQSRSVAGGSTALTRGPGMTAPAWLRLRRRGNDFAGAISSDGTTWSHIGTHTLAMGATPQVGLAVSSFDNSRLNSAQFGNVTVRAPQAPFDDGAEPPNWPIRRTIPRIALLSGTPPRLFTLKVEDHPGFSQQLESSTDLQQWQPVTTLNNRDGVTFFVDSVGAGQRQKFYRVTVVPP